MQANYKFCDQLTRVRTHNVRAEDLTVLLVAHDLHEAFRFTCSTRSAACTPRERTDFDVVTLLARCCFREPDRRDFRVTVRDGRNVVVVDHTVADACEILYDSNALVTRF